MIRWPDLELHGTFASEPVLGTRRDRRLLAPVSATWVQGPGGPAGALVVPAGYVSDGATIPALGRLFWEPHGRFGYAAWFHDALYQNAATGGESWTQRDADDFLLAVLKLTGLGWADRNLAWIACRAWGWTYWRDGD